MNDTNELRFTDPDTGKQETLGRMIRLHPNWAESLIRNQTKALRKLQTESRQDGEPEQKPQPRFPSAEALLKEHGVDVAQIEEALESAGFDFAGVKVLAVGL